MPERVPSKGEWTVEKTFLEFKDGSDAPVPARRVKTAPPKGPSSAPWDEEQSAEAGTGPGIERAATVGSSAAPLPLHPVPEEDASSQVTSPFHGEWTVQKTFLEFKDTSDHPAPAPSRRVKTAPPAPAAPLEVSSRPTPADWRRCPTDFWAHMHALFRPLVPEDALSSVPEGKPTGEWKVQKTFLEYKDTSDHPAPVPSRRVKTAPPAPAKVQESGPQAPNQPHPMSAPGLTPTPATPEPAGPEPPAPAALPEPRQQNAVVHRGPCCYLIFPKTLLKSTETSKVKYFSLEAGGSDDYLVTLTPQPEQRECKKAPSFLKVNGRVKVELKCQTLGRAAGTVHFSIGSGRLIEGSQKEGTTVQHSGGKCNIDKTFDLTVADEDESCRVFNLCLQVQ